MSWGQGSRGKEECFGGRAAAPGRGCRSPSRRPPVLTGSRAAAPRAAGVRAAATRAAAHRGPHGCFHPVRIPPIRRCCTLSASPAHPPRRAAPRLGAARAACLDCLFVSLTALVVFVPRAGCSKRPPTSCGAKENEARSRDQGTSEARRTSRGGRCAWPAPTMPPRLVLRASCLVRVGARPLFGRRHPALARPMPDTASDRR